MTATSGRNYVHHLFTATLSLIESMSKPSVVRAEELAQNEVVIDTRVSVLEHQFTSFVAQNDLDFAIQQELNDWNENRAMERFVVLTGLAPAPQKMSGGSYISFIIKKLYFSP